MRLTAGMLFKFKARSKFVDFGPRTSHGSSKGARDEGNNQLTKDSKFNATLLDDCTRGT